MTTNATRRLAILALIVLSAFAQALLMTTAASADCDQPSTWGSDWGGGDG